MKVAVEIWENGLAIRLPDDFAQGHGLKAGSRLELEFHSEGTRLTARRRPRYTLEDLLASVPEDWEPEAWDTGPPVGKEIW